VVSGDEWGTGGGGGGGGGVGVVLEAGMGTVARRRRRRGGGGGGNSGVRGAYRTPESEQPLTWRVRPRRAGPAASGGTEG